MSTFTPNNGITPDFFPCDAVSIPPACEILHRNDGVLLVPTETVYGLVCDAASLQAQAKIYEMKHRPANKLLTLFFASRKAVLEHFTDMPRVALVFMRRFCPGPITLVVPDGAKTTGFRIPDQPFLLNLLREYTSPLASTSANLSGTPPAHSVREALNSLAFPPDGIIDGGMIPKTSLPSTVIQVFPNETWSILRFGPVTETMLRTAWEESL